MNVPAVNLKKIRELKNITQEFMAKELNISQSQYQRIETGEGKMKEDVINKVAKIFEVSPETLYDFDEKSIFQSGNTNAIVNKINHGTMNFYQIDSKLEALYEDKIRHLEEQIELLKKT